MVTGTEMNLCQQGASITHTKPRWLPQLERTTPLLWVCLQKGKINPVPGALGIRWSSPPQFYSQDIVLCCSPPCPPTLQGRKGNAKHEHPRRRVGVCLWLSEAQENRGTVAVLKPHRAYSYITPDSKLQLQTW